MTCTESGKNAGEWHYAMLMVITCCVAESFVLDIRDSVIQQAFA